MFENLRCSKEGLTTEAAEERLGIFGHNKLEEKKVRFLGVWNEVEVFVFLIVCVLVLQESKVLKFLGFMWNPLSWVMEAAAIMAIALANGGVCFLYFFFLRSLSVVCLLGFLFGLFFVLILCGDLQGKPPDWQDFVGIITLLVINSTISFIEENNAGNAAAALMARLAPKAKVFVSFS